MDSASVHAKVKIENEYEHEQDSEISACIIAPDGHRCVDSKKKVLAKAGAQS